MEDIFTKKRRFSTRTVSKEEMEDPAKEKEDFDKAWRSKAEAQEAGHSSTDPKQDHIMQNQKVAITNIKKCHAAWDTSRRDFEAVIQLSKDHMNTQNCKVQLDLSSIVTQCTDQDQKLLEWECKVKQGGQMNNQDIMDSAGICNNMSEQMKLARRKAQGLRSMFKM